MSGKRAAVPIFKGSWRAWPIFLSGMIGLAGAGSAAASAQSGALPLMPHRAVYDMKLSDAGDGVSISDITGRMVYEMTGSACEGYSVNLRIVTRFVDDSGTSSITDLRNSTFEEPDANTLEFLSQTYSGQTLTMETRGTAEEKDNRLTISLTEPEEKKVETGKDVYYPISHIQALINAAREGGSFFEADVFDGAETGEKVYGTAAVIGAPQSGEDAPGEEEAKAVSGIGAGQRWPVTIAYFDPELDHGGEATPVYQISFLLYENGVSRKLKLDYGDFKLEGKLTNFEALPAAAPCKK
ncbi:MULTISPECIES: cell envelope integrity EipB family protein [unclassified Pannonibacter]|uniref:cell envelope integrity EipB family protein n=1 Tax=unclassified Pannonibacter TaxID=2627228 RepID=UPI00164613AF|nr:MULTISPECIES: cell envelope integrity EipB family protein [unclassified Pannonibacter]